MTTLINEESLELFIGIDVHLKSWHVSICTRSLTLKTFTQPPEVEALIHFLHKHYPHQRYHSVYEAGFSGFWLHRQLLAAGIDNIVVNASDVPTTDKEKRQKRDQVDSLKLAKSLRSGHLRGIYVPDREALYYRSLSRTRAQLVQDIARYKQRVKSTLRAFGITIPEEHLRSRGYWSGKFKAWIYALEEAPPSIMHLLLSMEDLQQRKKTVEQHIEQLAQSDAFRQQMDLITSIPGVSRTSGMILLTELMDIKRFRRFDDLCSYVGLIPNVHASGDKEYIGSMTHRGNKRIKRILVECSWWAIRKDPVLTKTYEELKKRMTGHKAIIRIARKLLSRIRSVLINKTPYQLGLLCVE
jgi:transposase